MTPGVCVWSLTMPHPGPPLSTWGADIKMVPRQPRLLGRENGIPKSPIRFTILLRKLVLDMNWIELGMDLETDKLLYGVTWL